MRSDMLSPDNEPARDVQHGLTSPIDRQNCEEMNIAQHSNGPALHIFLGMGDSINANQNEDAQVEAPYRSPIANVEVIDEDSFSYTDKKITELELSEKVGCFRGVDCHVIKDICIDEGSHLLGKIFIETDNKDEKNSSSQNQFATNEEDGKSSFIWNPFATDGDDGATKDLSNIEVPVSNGLGISLTNGHPSSVAVKDNVDRCSSESSHEGGGKLGSDNQMISDFSAQKLSVQYPITVFDNDDARQCSSGSLLEGVCKLDSSNKIMSEFSAEKLNVEQVLALQELDTNPAQVDTSSFCSGNDQKQPFEPHKKIDQVKLEESNSLTTSVASAVNESDKSNEAQENLADFKVENRVITFHFDSGVMAESGRYDSKSEETSPDDATASARSSFVRQSHGESSFLGPAVLSGRIALSGHIAYSGSISLRSDSSTTSARSFAFPILQPEWNSSPVKMAKADRRHLRKHRGWRMRLMCCRF